jgi:hypothetical protein
LIVLPQAEQLYYEADASHLSQMDEVVQGRFGSVVQAGTVYVSRAGLGPAPGHFAGEGFLEQAMAAAGVSVLRPESMLIVEQLRAYVSAERLIFAEGSAVYASQLLGRHLGDTMIVGRRPGSRIAETALKPRCRSLEYLDATRGLLTPPLPHLGAAQALGLSILNRDRLLDGLAKAVPALASYLPASAFDEARDTDVLAWFGAHLASPLTKGLDWPEHSASELAASGLSHLGPRVISMLEQHGYDASKTFHAAPSI